LGWNVLFMCATPRLSGSVVRKATILVGIDRVRQAFTRAVLFQESVVTRSCAVLAWRLPTAERSRQPRVRENRPSEPRGPCPATSNSFSWTKTHAQDLAQPDRAALSVGLVSSWVDISAPSAPTVSVTHSFHGTSSKRRYPQLLITCG
jgi:hypothetical protein